MSRASTTRTSAALRDSFVALLRIPTANLPNEKVNGYLSARLVGLGHGKACSRCGGSGHYSSNAIDGTRCFGCRGACYVAPSLTPDLYARVESDVRDGKLDTYLADLREKRAIEKETKFAPKDGVQNDVSRFVPTV